MEVNYLHYLFLNLNKGKYRKIFEKKFKEVINGNTFFACNENAWYTYDIMKLWLNEIWLLIIL